MSTWQPTLGKWDDEENYTASAPLQYQALRFAETWHADAGSALSLSDGSTMPYPIFLRHVMHLLSVECNLSGYDILTSAAFYGLLDETPCCAGDVEDALGTYVASLAQNMARDGEELGEYILNLLYDGESAAVFAQLAAQITLARLIPPAEEEKEELLSAFAPLQNSSPFALLLEKLTDALAGGSV